MRSRASLRMVREVAKSVAAQSAVVLDLANAAMDAAAAEGGDENGD